MLSKMFKFVILLLLHQAFFGSGGQEDHLQEKVICDTICKNQNSGEFCQCEQQIKFKEWNTKNKEYSPSLLCKSNNTISYRWNHHNISAHLYVALIKVSNSIWMYHDQSINHDTLTIKNLKSHTTYDVRTWLIMLSNLTAIGPIEEQRVTTSANGAKSLPVSGKSIKIIDYSCTKRNCDVLVQWTPASDFSCYYSMICFGDEYFEERYVDNPATLFLYNIEGLEYDHNYTLQIRPKQTLDWYSDGGVTSYAIRTPTCLEKFPDLSICPPEKPRGINVTYGATPAGHDFEFHFNVSWFKPKLQPDLYEVTVLPLEFNATRISVNVSGESTSVNILNIKVRHMYHLVLKALSPAGWSVAAVYEGDVIYPESTSTNFPVIATGVFMILCISLSLGVYIYRQITKQKKDEDRRRYFLELEQNVSANTKTAIVDYALQGYVADEWEINFEDIILENVLGHGAFGIVKHGWVKIENTRTEAAVKMLRNSSTVEEIHEFLQEIEIMKTVGKHPHLVSLLGCCINPELGPLLVSEFCSRGDLQTYLRNIWERISNKQTSSANDLATVQQISYENCKSQGQQFINKLYDIDAECESRKDEFLLKDLISIARQVTMGMEYLSSLKVLHRDLAARNVLLCEDKTAKVSDFGLSRDVYNNNIYCKMAGGRLPIRWMAIESLTHQRYTMYSDVWSFGVLLWEIVSLGATPYPEIENESLLKLLKSGYRMERPSNCPSDIYSIMQLCWKTAPKNRPSFLEIRKMLETVLESGVEYLHLDMHSYTSNSLDDHKKPPEAPQLQSVGNERYL